jgi:hypothetical protein
MPSSYILQGRTLVEAMNIQRASAPNAPAVTMDRMMTCEKQAEDQVNMR